MAKVMPVSEKDVRLLNDHPLLFASRCGPRLGAVLIELSKPDRDVLDSLATRNIVCETARAYRTLHNNDRPRGCCCICARHAPTAPLRASPKGAGYKPYSNCEQDFQACNAIFL